MASCLSTLRCAIFSRSQFLRPHLRSIAYNNHHFHSKMSTATTTINADVLSTTDPEQARLMAERVILVDKNDKPLGSMSKKDAHLQSNNLPLHRAFSLFLFDSHGRMLLQQRAPSKITFPSFWTNTVCSHPLHTPSELGADANDPVLGAKRAAIRKLTHELGVVNGAVSVDDLHFMARILYRAECDDGIWGEHELDYVFFAQKDVELSPEPNEVCNVKYVDAPALRKMFKDSKSEADIKLTPWFCHIVQSFGWEWWQVLLSKGTPGLPPLQDVKIHVMGKPTL